VDIPAAPDRHIGEELARPASSRSDDLPRRAFISGAGRAQGRRISFTEPMHALDVIDKIARGDVYKRLTFREG
jgi:hypothetical protein